MANPVESDGLRVIKTARTEEAINRAAKAGFFPLVKEVKPSLEIRQKFAVFQDRSTGEIMVAGDYRIGQNGDPVVPFTFYYPYCFPSPFAAYLIPPDLEVGEVVFLEDLIEDLIGARWNQGDAYRLEACQATWLGHDFEIHHSESNVDEVVG